MLLKYPKHVIAFLFLAAIYISQITLVKPNEIALKKYHISANDARLLALAIALPYIAIWILALAGYLGLRSYSDKIKKGKDGRAFEMIAEGVLWLALWLPLSTILNNEVIHLYESHPNLVASMVRLDNLINILLMVPGFVLVYLGSRKLTDLAKTTIRTPSQMLILFYVAFSAVYTFLVLHDPVRQVASGPTLKATYYQPDWLIVTTIVIPRLILWYLGLNAVQNIYLYRSKVKGTLYRVALQRLAIGLCGVVLSSIILRCFQSFTPQLSRLSLSLVFTLLYAILLMLSLGYIWIYKGSKNLNYIENL